MIMGMHAFLYAIASAFLVSLVSLVGLATFPYSEADIQRITFILISLATGALFGDAVLHLLPTIFQNNTGKLQSGLLVLGGIFASFVFEKFLRWRQEHGLGGAHG